MLQLYQHAWQGVRRHLIAEVTPAPQEGPGSTSATQGAQAALQASMQGDAQASASRWGSPFWLLGIGHRAPAGRQGPGRQPTCALRNGTGLRTEGSSLHVPSSRIRLPRPHSAAARRRLLEAGRWGAESGSEAGEGHQGIRGMMAASGRRRLLSDPRPQTHADGSDHNRHPAGEGGRSDGGHLPGSSPAGDPVPSKRDSEDPWHRLSNTVQRRMQGYRQRRPAPVSSNNEAEQAGAQAYSPPALSEPVPADAAHAQWQDYRTQAYTPYSNYSWPSLPNEVCTSQAPGPCRC